jgi:hypothetical protein
VDLRRRRAIENERIRFTNAVTMRGGSRVQATAINRGDVQIYRW